MKSFARVSLHTRLCVRRGFYRTRRGLAAATAPPPRTAGPPGRTTVTAGQTRGRALRPVRLGALCTAAVLTVSLTGAVQSSGPDTGEGVGSAGASREAAGTGPGGQEKQPVATGHGGAVASVDEDASAAGIEVLKRGGNAVDAAVATAAALGVTEPYSAGIGGGGYFVYYDAKSGEVRTLDGRETAPRSADEDLLREDGEPIPTDEAITSGLSAGTPGTPATWERVLDDWGSERLSSVLRPAERLAREGFTVDETFREQTADNADRFRDFPASAELFLPGGEPPEVGSTLRNPDLARTYRQLADHGSAAMYQGEIGEDVVRAVRKPPVDPDADRTVRPGDMTREDLSAYRTVPREPTHSGYRGLDVYGMAPSSSGGTSVAEALNILERSDLGEMDEREYTHRFLEASRLAFADRDRWVGDPEHEDVPTDGLLSQEFADSRECLIDEGEALTSPVAPGDPRDPGAPGDCADAGSGVPAAQEGENTTHLTASDRWGNVVSYTLTIERTGGSGITVPGRGFLLNNQMTDFSFEQEDPDVPDPNLPGPGKRPRSSMSPTIVLDGGKPVVALGSPGGATIVTTVLQTLLGHLDRGMPLVDAMAAPRASQRNEKRTEVEPELDSDLREGLRELGHSFTESREIGAATGVRRLPDGRWLAAAEKERRGGGSAMVVRPDGGE